MSTRATRVEFRGDELVEVSFDPQTGQTVERPLSGAEREAQVGAEATLFGLADRHSISDAQERAMADVLGLDASDPDEIRQAVNQALDDNGAERIENGPILLRLTDGRPLVITPSGEISLDGDIIDPAQARHMNLAENLVRQGDPDVSAAERAVITGEGSLAPDQVDFAAQLFGIEDEDPRRAAKAGDIFRRLGSTQVGEDGGAILFEVPPDPSLPEPINAVLIDRKGNVSLDPNERPVPITNLEPETQKLLATLVYRRMHELGIESTFDGVGGPQPHVRATDEERMGVARDAMDTASTASVGSLLGKATESIPMRYSLRAGYEDPGIDIDQERVGGLRNAARIGAHGEDIDQAIDGAGWDGIEDAQRARDVSVGLSFP